ncbi:hypothetical protein DITRI_Ditri06bG0122100 [Diplodiscus trichospermus]
MAEELKGVWRMLTLTEEERDQVDIDGLRAEDGITEKKPWLVGRLITRRPFNKEAMLGMMRAIWRISKEAEVNILDENLFLFKFANKKDRDRVISGAPWPFDKQLLALMEYVTGVRLCVKGGNVLG